jgi:hypothetical protein
MKVTRADILSAISNTSSSLDKVSIRAMNSILLGVYTPKDANWSWELHAISINNNPRLVAVRFGQVVAEGK